LEFLYWDIQNTGATHIRYETGNSASINIDSGIGFIVARYLDPATPMYTITASKDSNSTITPSGIRYVHSGGSQTYNISANPEYHIAHVYVNNCDIGAVTSFTFGNVDMNHTISVTSSNISRVQYARGTTTGSSISMTLNSAPVNGNNLVAVISSSANYGFVNVSSISQTGVNWSTSGAGKQVGNQLNDGQYDLLNVEIWVGIIGAGASNSLTVNLSGSAPEGACCNISEYQGIANSNFLDKTAYSYGIAYPHPFTGNTQTTTEQNELFIGGIVCYEVTQTSDSFYGYAFNLLDGQPISTGSWTSLTYVEKIDAPICQAQEWLDTQATYVGCIATFKAATTRTITATADAHSSISPSGTVSVPYGTNQTFTITPNEGYHITHVYVDNVDQGAISSHTFSTVTANHTISVTSEITTVTYVITTSPDANSSMSPSNPSVNSGLNQTITISPNTGYVITHVYVDSVDQGVLTAYTFSNVTANHTISCTSTAMISITRVQSKYANATPSVTLNSQPTNGNVLIAVIASVDTDDGDADYPSITGITQTGVTWYLAKQAQYYLDYYFYYDIEIWYGIVGSNAGTSITPSFNYEIPDPYICVCEYSGLRTSGLVDKTASYGDRTTTANTGTTAVTAQAHELLVGGVFQSYTIAGHQTWSNPTNGFVVLDGADFAYLEKIVTSTGTANSGATCNWITYWVGCMATFKATT